LGFVSKSASMTGNNRAAFNEMIRTVGESSQDLETYSNNQTETGPAWRVNGTTMYLHVALHIHHPGHAKIWILFKYEAVQVDKLSGGEFEKE
jgi:hypothetical protein